MSNETAGEVESGGEQEELDQIEAPPGVIEAIELYEAVIPYYVAVIPHYVAAAARLALTSQKISSTRTTLAANYS